MPQPLYPWERHPLLWRLSALRNRSGGGGEGNETLQCTSVIYFGLTTSDISFTFFLKFPQPPSRSSPQFSLTKQHPLQGYNFHVVNCKWADRSGRAVQGVGLRPFAQWDCGFEFCQGHGYLSPVVLRVVKWEVSARADYSSRVIVPSVVSDCDRYVWLMRRPLLPRSCCAMRWRGWGRRGGLKVTPLTDHKRNSL
jgi:hypothetical protein